MRRGLVLAALLASTALLTAPAMAAGYKFEKVGTIKLPGKPGHGDIVTYDPSNKMIYVSLVDDGLAVVDTRTNKVVHYIQNVPSPNGNDADANYVYVACADGPGAGKVNAIAVISKKTWKEVARVTTKGTSPDWIEADPKNHLVYTTSDDNNWIEVYTSGAKPAFKAKWPLYPPKGGPDVAILLEHKHRIFQSVDSWLDEVNTNTGAVVGHVDTHVKLTKKGGTKDFAYDAAHNRLWNGTTTGGMWVWNPDTLTVIKKLPEKGQGVDQVGYDPKLGLVYAFDGGAKGVDAYDANAMTYAGFLPTGVGLTHSGTVDTDTHVVYAYAGDAGALMLFKPVKE